MFFIFVQYVLLWLVWLGCFTKDQTKMYNLNFAVFARTNIKACLPLRSLAAPGPLCRGSGGGNEFLCDLQNFIDKRNRILIFKSFSAIIVAFCVVFMAKRHDPIIRWFFACSCVRVYPVMVRIVRTPLTAHTTWKAWYPSSVFFWFPPFCFLYHFFCSLYGNWFYNVKLSGGPVFWAIRL